MAKHAAALPSSSKCHHSRGGAVTFLGSSVRFFRFAGFHQRNDLNTAIMSLEPYHTVGTITYQHTIGFWLGSNPTWAAQLRDGHLCSQGGGLVLVLEDEENLGGKPRWWWWWWWWWWWEDMGGVGVAKICRVSLFGGSVPSMRRQTMKLWHIASLNLTKLGIYQLCPIVPQNQIMWGEIDWIVEG